MSLQKVEILRAVACEARVIVMDEPTSSLTSVETSTLHRMIRTLRERGRTIVYVSHFLDEVLDLADTVTVLRSGRLVRTGPAAEETEESLVAGMFGAAAAAEHFEKPQHLTAAVVLDVSGLHRKGVLRDISLRIRAGEIVGLAGLVGSGRSELARAIAGADPIDRGSIVVDGTTRRIRSPADAMAAGMAFLPESRKDDGLFLGLSLAANTTFADLRAVASRFGVLRLALERRKTSALLKLTSVEPPVPSAKVANLSGGNQQKVLFARWLFRNPRVLILDEPTRGVDVAARAAIHRLINNLAAEGTAVLLISSEVEEVLGLAHRVLVMRRGSIIREFGADPPMEAVMEAAFGSEVLGAYAAGHWGVAWAFPVAIGAGAAMGLINGLLVTKLRVNAFLATLASALTFGGIAVGVTNGGLLITPTSTAFTFLGQHRAGGIQYPVIIFAVVAIVLQLVLAYTVFGRHLYGVGDNRSAARLSGLKVDRTVDITFVITGAACGLAGLIDASTTGSGTSDMSGLGGQLALLAIAGVALGGSSIFGGVGSVWRTVLGVLMLGMITNGFNLLAVQDFWQNIVRGILIIIAVAIGMAVDRP